MAIVKDPLASGKGVARNVAPVKDEAPSSTGEVFLSHRVVGGVPWAIVSKGVLFFVYFGVSILTVRVLGAEKFGIFSICKNIGEYLLVVCSLGLNTALIRFVPELLVAQNRAGLTRFLWKAGILQAAAVIAAATGLWFAGPFFDKWFNVHFGYLLVFTALLVGMQVYKDFFNDTFTALFRVRTASILSVCQGVIWCGLLALMLPQLPEVSVVILVQATSALIAGCAGMVLLVVFIRRQNWRSPLSGIGVRRTLGISLSSMVNTMANMLMRKYTEVFFLGVFFSPALVGMYDLGYSMPMMIITFIPLAVQKLFTSGFAEAYAQDANCLERLISFFYKALILTVMPFAAFGAFFAPRMIALCYGASMATAGTIAGIFFLIHVVSLVYVPLSMGIVAKEKILQTVPLTIMQIVVKLLLDYLLIPRFGISGAVAAVICSFAITLPVHLYVVYRILGGIYFPVAFLARVAIPLLALAAAMSPLAPFTNIGELLGLGAVYLIVYIAMIKRFGLIDQEDLVALKGLRFGKLNAILSFLERAEK